MELIAIGLLVAPFAILVAVSRNRRAQRALAAATVELTVDARGLHRVLRDGRTEGVRWDEVAEVEVLTAATGPHADAGGVVIVGDGEQRGCLVPLDRAASSGLIEELCKLPGFELNRFVDAAQAKAPTRTRVWTRPGTS